MPPAPAKKALVFADPNYSGQPICLECFLRHKNTAEDPAERQDWQNIQQFAVAAWAKLAEDKKQRLGIDEPLGWAKFLVLAMKWPRIKGRCWGCSAQLAKSYRVLVEEVQGAAAVKEYAASCGQASEDANRLALEIEASGYRPGAPIFQPDPRYDPMVTLARVSVASLDSVLTEPQAIGAKPLWAWARPRILLVMTGDIDFTGQYNVLGLGIEKLRKIAAILRQTASMKAVTAHNFAGVVQAHAKDPHNPPERLTLVMAYQWAKELNPPMGYLELAKVLIAWNAVDEWEDDDAEDLAANIKTAVSRYRHLMPLESWYFGFARGVTPPP